MRTLLFPLIVGLGGIAILLSLANWQMDRLAWKEDILANITSKLDAPAVPLLERPDSELDNYRSVIFEGQPTGEELRVLDSGTAAGTGHHIISAFETTDGRRVMVDQGLLGINDADAQVMAPMIETITVQGNLIWPDDPDTQPAQGDEWYTRDVDAMALVLNTEPMLIQLSAASQYDPRLIPLAVDIRNIKNDHLEYAITWLLLAVVWGAMTMFYIARALRQTRPTTEKED